MTTRKQIDVFFDELEGSPLLMDGFDEAIIGYSQRGNERLLAVYSYEKMVEVLVSRDRIEYEEAVEYIDFNCVGAWVGDETPIIVMSLSFIEKEN